MNEENLYNTIYHHDYLVRYKACQKILDYYEIPLGIAEIRKVFPYIITNDIYNLEEQGINRFELAKNNLKTFVSEYNTHKDYSEFSKEELDDSLLDECYIDSPLLDKIKKLVSLGADINARDQNGQTAFMYAVRHEDFDIMEFFLKNGADTNTVYPPPPAMPDDYNTVWLQGLKYAEPDYIKLMVRYNANILEKDSENNTVLHVYCDGNPALEILELFVENSVDINAQNSEGNTALHYLCEKKVKTECISTLLENNADSNIQNDEGKTPLHYACWVHGADKNIVEILLHSGADPNIKDIEGNTPLFIAVYRENEKLIKSLVSFGADVSIKNDKGKTAYEIAIAKGYIKVAEKISGDKAKKDYKESPNYNELQQLKKQIITNLKAGKYKYYSNKEGYAKFLYRNGKFFYEWYEMGQEPPETTCYSTEKEALQFLHDHSTSRYTGDPDEIDIYKDILDMLCDEQD